MWWRDESFVLAIDDDVRGGSLGDVAGLIQENCPTVGLARGGFAIGEVEVHATAALQLGRQAARGDLADGADERGDAGFVLRGPRFEWQREAMNADSWSAAAGDAWRGEGDDRPIVTWRY